MGFWSKLNNPFTGYIDPGRTVAVNVDPKNRSSVYILGPDKSGATD
jgi:hypothetical protein